MQAAPDRCYDARNGPNMQPDAPESESMTQFNQNPATIGPSRLLVRGTRFVFFMATFALILAAGQPALAQDVSPTGAAAAGNGMSDAGASDEAKAPEGAKEGDADARPRSAPAQAAKPEPKAYTIPERFVLVDPSNGLAIGGYDPVAFFVDHRARPGRRQFELVWSKTIWTFANEGNLAVFKEAPQIYAPQFGGHDAQALANGRIAPGDPRVWVLHNQRLYFFHSPARRFEWLIAPDQHVREAEAEWDKKINVRFGAKGSGR